jgi:hypothetical protein
MPRLEVLNLAELPRVETSTDVANQLHADRRIVRRLLLFDCSGEEGTHGLQPLIRNAGLLLARWDRGPGWMVNVIDHAATGTADDEPPVAGERPRAPDNPVRAR